MFYGQTCSVPSTRGYPRWHDITNKLWSSLASGFHNAAHQLSVHFSFGKVTLYLSPYMAHLNQHRSILPASNYNHLFPCIRSRKGSDSFESCLARDSIHSCIMTCIVNHVGMMFFRHRCKCVFYFLLSILF